ncbi:MAG: helix-turn-helix transcriptional regulator [Clostridia bacterium]|nr:helix-turn-helix transcriptional regulator [Clostridia bacterium]
MANAKRVGTLIKNARLDAGLTQEQLARKVRGCSANDISRAERGEKELTTDQLKQIAKATGVTQKSLLDAAKGSSSSSSSRSGALTVSMKVTATEKRLVELYRAADTNSKKNALKLLRGEGASALAEDLFESVWDSVTGKKK